MSDPGKAAGWAGPGNIRLPGKTWRACTGSRGRSRERRKFGFLTGGNRENRERVLCLSVSVLSLSSCKMILLPKSYE